jgi:hypothetical protein
MVKRGTFIAPNGTEGGSGQSFPVDDVAPDLRQLHFHLGKIPLGSSGA